MTTQHVKLTGDAADAPRIRETAAIVRAGGLVAFPTETVYGLAANADDPAAMTRLRAVKERPSGKPFSIHVADPEQIERHAPKLALVARKAIAKLLPGPVTLVLPDGRGGFVGIRLPAHEVARQFLREAAVPVVAPSANRADHSPPTDAQQVLAELDGRIDAVLDAGPTPIRESSTVVQVGRGPIQVFRSGLVTEDDVRRAARVLILVVCTGNSCRSPIAEVLLRKRLAEFHGVPPDKLLECGYEVTSAGTAAPWSIGASMDAVEIAREMGADLSAHRSKPVSRDLLERAELVFGMTSAHVQTMREQAPDMREKIDLLGKDGAEIGDPIGGGIEEFRRCAKQIDAAIVERLEEL